MLKIFASIFIIINTLSAIFPIFKNQDASQTEAPLFSPSAAQNIIPQPLSKLPLQEDAFLNIQQLPIWPERNWNISEPDIAAKTALIINTSNNQILYQKNGIYDAHPIASLTKLMTALVVLEKSPLDKTIKISPRAVATEGEMGSLRVGEEVTIETLLYALLAESSNDAAVALAENIPAPSSDGSASSTGSIASFVKSMNLRATAMHLKNTGFADPSGLDPANYSCAWDITKMMQTAVAQPLLRQIMQTKTVDLPSIDGKFNHHIVNTDKLLGVIPEIIGGKTGYTEEAGNCMALATKTPDNQEMLLIVVMDAKNRAAETQTLFEWTKKAFLW